jgi:1-acyl-sn-glycerol-3-phosphate acyltransferase
MLSWLARRILALFGWRLVGALPATPKYVIIAAPHTSNWDFIVAILAAAAFGLRINFMMKDELFRPPWGWFFRALGGIPINRRSNNNVVQQMVQRFAERERLALVIPPEGTRSKVTKWKTGFYYIALGAGVPILLGFADFARKQVGSGPLITPTGDIEADLAGIRAFYSGIVGKRPELFGEITTVDRSTPDADSLT